MLHTSTKNVAYEVISCLIWIEPGGANQGQSQTEKQLIGKLNGTNSTTGGSGAAQVCRGVLTDVIKWLTMTNQHQMLNDVEFSILD